MIDVKIIDDKTSGSKLKKLKITYQGKQYSYLETEWSPFCCGWKAYFFTETMMIREIRYRLSYLHTCFSKLELI